MKTFSFDLRASNLFLAAALCWCGSALRAQQPPQRQTVTMDGRVLDTYVGQYELVPKVLLTLRREGRHLMAQISGQPWIVVYAENETKFFWKVMDAQFTIQKDDNGNVEGLLFEQGAVK